ncbi:Steroid 21-hydroxylase [Colletotrichum chlorophyti]|uniref:Steroid 21-hydroxylase n=1 Tax=Colletotrichum chlorophyti TaxID=708187 RepID=A0A1Q8RN60_9PEZI|nr:Steroid 21-hydroxylase [Colletotrichum chlorophyti]
MSLLSRFSFNPSPSWAVGLGIVSVLLWLYYRALPKPLPGIPYNPEALSIYGDIPSLTKYAAKHQVFSKWMALQTERLRSPIVQVFIRPFSAPRVVLCDFRETQDILLRRQKEFDRSDIQGDLFEPLVPDHHIHMKTNSTFKAHRKLLQDLMTPAFLNQVAAPAIHLSASHLVMLWREKMRLARGRPFEASIDFYRGALDAVLAFTFGSQFQHSAIKPQLELVRMQDGIPLPPTVDDPAEIPIANDDDGTKVILNFTKAVEKVIGSPFPRMAFALMKLKPSWKKTMAVKNELLRKEIQNAISRLGDKSEADRIVSAVDHIVHRETKLAEKEGRSPLYHCGTIYDEVIGFVVAGHETTSNTLSWSVKYLADNPAVQTRLRRQLRTAMSIAVDEGRHPTAEEIVKAKTPYLDACMEEILRLASTVAFIARQATRNTEILGHPVTEGTQVFMLMEGASVLSPAFDIDGSKRNRTEIEAVNKVGEWDPADVGVFNPDRWLEPSQEPGHFENMAFQSMAGPSFAFGLGIRGCFGRRLAYLEMKLLLTAIIWNFELKTCPPELSTYEAKEKFVRSPVHCYVRLGPAPNSD